MTSVSRRPLLVSSLAVVLVAFPAFGQRTAVFAQAPQLSQGVRFATIAESDLRAWLTYLSSDALQGRQTFTEGYGLAASFVAQELEKAGVKPFGDAGYFQTVRRVGYRVTQNSTLSVTVNGETRTFRHGEHVTFPTNGGRSRSLTFTGVDVAGYGLVALSAGHDDFKGRDVAGKLVVWMPGTPAAVAAAGGRGGRGSRSPFIVETFRAGAALTFAPAPAPPSPEVLSAEAAVAQAQQVLSDAEARLQAARAAAGGRGGGRGGRGGRGAQPAEPANLTTVQRVDVNVTPQITADEAVFEFLFSAAPVPFATWRARAEAGEPLAPFSLPGVTVSIAVDNTYQVVSTELTKNVVGLVEGSDPALRDTYVFYGAHLDHTGYRTSATGGRGGRAGGGGAQPGSNEPPDLIFNGADDDGSGSTALLGIAKAFATGPKPRRSVVFVWHAAEESGLLGSRYMADHPVVPVDRIQAVLNADMIGRNRNDDPALSNSVYVIGADRISTDLHNLLVDANGTLAKPLTLDYEYNDPSDSNSFYTRSDHYSYAARGIPIAFFFTGTHADYHQASDEVDKIIFPKLARIADFLYQAGFHLANSERTLTKDNLGPRAGVGFQGRISR